MFESIFVAPHTQQRHREALFCEERIAYLQHMRAQGSARQSLRQTAEHLVWLTLRMTPEARTGIDADGLKHLFGEPGAKNSSTPYQQRLLLEARRWFQFLGWWREDIQRVEVDPALVRIPVNVTTDSGNVTGNSGERDRWVGVARFNFMPSCFFG